MKVVVINLERSRDRRALMQQTLDRLGIRFEFFRGIDGTRGEHLASSRYDEQTSILDRGLALSPGEIGCFASHYLLWQRCADEREPMIVMEDDLVIGDGFISVLAAVEALVNRFHLIRLGIIGGCAPFGRFCDLDENLQMIRFAKNSMVPGTQCYALSPKGAAELVRHAAVWSLSVDEYMSTYTMHGLENYGILPYFVAIADQGAFSTTIDDRWRQRPRLSFGFAVARELLRFGRDRKSGLYQLIYSLSQLRCALFRLLLPGTFPIP